MLEKGHNWYAHQVSPPRRGRCKLPLRREKVENLHPSTLRLLEEDPVEYYLRHMAPLEHVPADEEQGFPAAVGTAFDAAVKQFIATWCGVPCKPLDEMLAKVVTRPAEATQMGYALLVGYGACGALSDLVSQGISGLEIHSEHGLAPGTKVPIGGTLDATLRLGAGHLVHDWKVTGSGRPGTTSPRKGYLRLLDTAGEGKGPHVDHGCPLEYTDERWATQVTIYAWLLGEGVAERWASIDELVVGKPEGAGYRVRVAQHRAKVTVAFQEKVRDRLEDAWKRIRRNEVVPLDVGERGLEFVKAMR